MSLVGMDLRVSVPASNDIAAAGIPFSGCSEPLYGSFIPAVAVDVVDIVLQPCFGVYVVFAVSVD